MLHTRTADVKRRRFDITVKGIDIGDALKQLKTVDGRKALYTKHREIIMYVIFGVLTTVISFATYYIFRWIFPDENAVPVWLRWVFNITETFGTESNTALPVILSWICAVTFAFVTNRIYVFRSEAKKAGILREFVTFYLSRLLTLLVDLVIMFLLVDLTGIENALYEFAAKVLSNIVVLILNYVLSKIFVFRKK